MFLIESRRRADGHEGDELPGHFLIFASEVRSYRDLPLRFHEQTPLHRNEASGVLSGLTRVRQFSQDDAHCFVTQEQIGDEVERLLRLVQRVYGDFGLPFTAEALDPAGGVPRRDRDLGSRRGAAEARRSTPPAQPYTINEGDGAFYGPKIDFDVTDAIGRKWQCATIQLDYQMPERFDLKYIGADNAEHRPVVIHRAIFGSFERFIAHPDRALRRRVSAVAGAGAGDRAADCRPPPATTRASVRDRLAAAGLRVELDERQEKIGYKIREAQLQKIPYMLVVGDREAAEGTVSVRSRTGGDLGAQTRRRVRRRRARRKCARRARARRAAGVGRSSRSCKSGGRYRFRQKSRAATTASRVNERIRVREIRVIDDTGAAARHHAAAAGAGDRQAEGARPGRDLADGGPAGLPHHGLRASISTRSRSARARRKKHQKVIEVKEIKFRPKVDEHDYQFKKKHIERFLEDGDKVKATIFFRGREMAHPEIGRRILERLIEDLADVAIAETMPRQEGNQMHTILAQRPGKKPAPKSEAEPKTGQQSERPQSTSSGRAGTEAETRSCRN